MPQMAPMNWLSLMIMFIVIFMMFNLMNYFVFMYQNKTLSIKTNKFLLNWKW